MNLSIINPIGENELFSVHKKKHQKHFSDLPSISLVNNTTYFKAKNKNIIKNQTQKNFYETSLHKQKQKSFHKKTNSKIYNVAYYNEIAVPYPSFQINTHMPIIFKNSYSSNKNQKINKTSNNFFMVKNYDSQRESRLYNYTKNDIKSPLTLLKKKKLISKVLSPYRDKDNDKIFTFPSNSNTNANSTVNSFTNKACNTTNGFTKITRFNFDNSQQNVLLYNSKNKFNNRFIINNEKQIKVAKGNNKKNVKKKNVTKLNKPLIKTKDFSLELNKIYRNIETVNDRNEEIKIVRVKNLLNEESKHITNLKNEENQINEARSRIVGDIKRSVEFSAEIKGKEKNMRNFYDNRKKHQKYSKKLNRKSNNNSFFNISNDKFHKSFGFFHNFNLLATYNAREDEVYNSYRTNKDIMLTKMYNNFYIEKNHSFIKKNDIDLDKNSISSLISSGSENVESKRITSKNTKTLKNNSSELINKNENNKKRKLLYSKENEKSVDNEIIKNQLAFLNDNKDVEGERNKQFGKGIFYLFMKSSVDKLKKETNKIFNVKSNNKFNSPNKKISTYSFHKYNIKNKSNNEILSDDVHKKKFVYISPFSQRNYVSIKKYSKKSKKKIKKSHKKNESEEEELDEDETDREEKLRKIKEIDDLINKYLNFEIEENEDNAKSTEEEKKEIKKEKEKENENENENNIDKNKKELTPKQSSSKKLKKYVKKFDKEKFSIGLKIVNNACEICGTEKTKKDTIIGCLTNFREISSKNVLNFDVEKKQKKVDIALNSLIKSYVDNMSKQKLSNIRKQKLNENVKSLLRKKIRALYALANSNLEAEYCEDGEEEEEEEEKKDISKIEIIKKLKKVIKNQNKGNDISKNNLIYDNSIYFNKFNESDEILEDSDFGDEKDEEEKQYNIDIYLNKVPDGYERKEISPIKNKFKKRKRVGGLNKLFDETKKNKKIDDQEEIRKKKEEILDKKLKSFYDRIKELSKTDNYKDELRLFFEQEIEKLDYSEETKTAMRKNNFFNELKYYRAICKNGRLYVNKKLQFHSPIQFSTSKIKFPSDNA